MKTTKPIGPHDALETKRRRYIVRHYREHESDARQATTCHEFGAMGYSRYGGRVSGLVGLTCARHMFAMQGGFVDMDGGGEG